jgi:hypothetical protein
MDGQDKRKLRAEKRIVKRAGSQRRRRVWKRELAEDPEGAPYSGENFGRYGSARLNGIDRTRDRDKADEVEE